MFAIYEDSNFEGFLPKFRRFLAHCSTKAWIFWERFVLRTSFWSYFARQGTGFLSVGLKLIGKFFPRLLSGEFVKITKCHLYHNNWPNSHDHKLQFWFGFHQSIENWKLIRAKVQNFWPLTLCSIAARQNLKFTTGCLGNRNTRQIACACYLTRSRRWKKPNAFWFLKIRQAVQKLLRFKGLDFGINVARLSSNISKTAALDRPELANLIVKNTFRGWTLKRNNFWTAWRIFKNQKAFGFFQRWERAK